MIAVVAYEVILKIVLKLAMLFFWALVGMFNLEISFSPRHIRISESPSTVFAGMNLE
jgi:hypothetical protein